VYVLKRANGVCEACANPAPFFTAKKRPYLEPHHVGRLADGGPDHPRFVAAVCPNCHRRVHSGADGSAYNAKIAEFVATREK
jgi:5-methylcytosine-specific restriction protein A